MRRRTQTHAAVPSGAYDDEVDSTTAPAGDEQLRGCRPRRPGRERGHRAGAGRAGVTDVEHDGGDVRSRDPAPAEH